MYLFILHSQNCYIKIYKYFFSGLVPVSSIYHCIIYSQGGSVSGLAEWVRPSAGMFLWLKILGIDPFWSLESRAGAANHSTPPYLNQNIPDQTLPQSDKQWPAALFAAVWTAVFTWVIKAFFKDAKEMVLLSMQIRPQTITNNAVMPQSLVLLLF